MLARFIDHEYADRPTWRCAAFSRRSASRRASLRPRLAHARAPSQGREDRFRIGHSLIYEPWRSCPTRSGIRIVAGPTCSRATRHSPRRRSTTSIRARFLHGRLLDEPGMAANMENVGAKYPVTFVDARRFPAGPTVSAPPTKDVPVALFWSSPCTIGNRLRTRQRPAVSVHQHHGQAVGECRRLDRHLLRPELARRREELAENPAGKGFS